MTWSALLLPLLFCTAAIFPRRASGVCVPDGPCACLERGSSGAKCLSQNHCLGGLLCAEERCHALPENLGDPCTRDSQCSSAVNNAVCGGRVDALGGVGVCQCGEQFRDYYSDGRCFSRGTTLPTDGASENVPSCTTDMNRTRWDIFLREFRGDILFVRVSDEEPLVLFAWVRRDTTVDRHPTTIYFCGAELWNYETQQLVQKIPAFGAFLHDVLFVHKTHVLTIDQQSPKVNSPWNGRFYDTFTFTRRSISNREPTIVRRILTNFGSPTRPSAAVHPNEPLVALASAYAAIQVYDTGTFQLVGTYGAATTTARRVVRWDPFASNKLFVANVATRPVIQLYVLNLSGNTFTTETFTGRRSITHEMTHDLTEPRAIKTHRFNPAVTHVGAGWILNTNYVYATGLRINLDNGDGTTTLIEPGRIADVWSITAIAASPRRRVIAVAGFGGMIVYRYPFCRP